MSSLILMEGRPCSGERDSEIVLAAWDFEEINSRYTRSQQVLRQRPCAKLASEADMRTFHKWLSDERSAWHNVMQIDPLLPERLLPADYAGRQTWALRKEVMAKAGQQMREFLRQ